ncbi:hypothetical protein NB703_002188 [Pantoea ananatis]|uniref:Uncharacterized protein n=1 Tax=Pantoea ananas TaxID=553 RepID=A0AAJ1CYZ6_PANAN|nr:hypothetical protein [Pantoea ananatis]MCW0332174.1 hypothetical protein [Pantoea ananatis]MCW0340356.1 hypothetical protein [Pantoea ananatis]MCW0344095.1 hypothetical protein [Pantoea ananatis]MCW0349493.1 hypothetical protein [Pantoea ananatis]
MSGVISRRLRLQAVGKGGTPSPCARHNTTPFSDWQPQLRGESGNALRRRLDSYPPFRLPQSTRFRATQFRFPLEPFSA